MKRNKNRPTIPRKSGIIGLIYSNNKKIKNPGITRTAINTKNAKERWHTM